MRGASYARGPTVGDCDTARFASPFFASTCGETLDREKQPIPHPRAPRLSPLSHAEKPDRVVARPAGGRAARGWRDLEALPNRGGWRATSPLHVRGSERARRLVAATPTPLLAPVLSSSSTLEVIFRRSDGREHKGGGGC
jgi:hypothetical protein